MFCTSLVNLGSIGLHNFRSFIDSYSLSLHSIDLVHYNEKEFWGFKEIMDFNMVLDFFRPFWVVLLGFSSVLFNWSRTNILA
jgi:hypothetical protein